MTSLVLMGSSSFARIVLKKRLQTHVELKIIGDFPLTDREALECVEKKKPDIVLLDLDTPSLYSVQVIRSLLEIHPTCIIILLLNLGQGSADILLKALENGAVDFIHKESSILDVDLVGFEKNLVEKIKQWSAHRKDLTSSIKSVSKENGAYSFKTKPSDHSLNIGFEPTQTTSTSAVFLKKPKKTIDLIVLGISTGGPLTLLSLLSKVNKLSCPLIIAQHMPSAFTKSLSLHLQYETSLHIVEGHHALPLEPGMIVIARGGMDSKVQRVSANQLMLVEKTDHLQGIHPSVNILFSSAAESGFETIGIMMTGMGSDGLEGAHKLHEKGMTVIAQHPDTCIVSGMPLSVVHAGLANFVLTPDQIADLLNTWAHA